MSATLKVYTRVVLEVNGVVLDVGDVLTPQKAITIDGTYRRHQTTSLAPGETVTIYSYDDHPEFQLIGVWVKGSGFVDIGVQHDAPTSTDDTTPAGTARTWQHTPLSCFCPLFLSSVDGLTNADPADHAEQNGTTAGFFEDADETRGRVYEVQIKNPDDATDDVTLEYVVIA